MLELLSPMEMATVQGGSPCNAVPNVVLRQGCKYVQRRVVDKAKNEVVRRVTSQKKTYTDSEWDAVRGVGPSAHSDAIRGPR